jgi:hypothetical protein
MQGEKMTKPSFDHIVGSILDVVDSSGIDVSLDLKLPEGKSIASLLNDQEKKEEDPEDDSQQKTE